MEACLYRSWLSDKKPIYPLNGMVENGSDFSQQKLGITQQYWKASTLS